MRYASAARNHRQPHPARGAIHRSLSVRIMPGIRLRTMAINLTQRSGRCAKRCMQFRVREGAMWRKWRSAPCAFSMMVQEILSPENKAGETMLHRNRDTTLHRNKPERAKKLAFGYDAPHHYMDDLDSTLLYNSLAKQPIQKKGDVTSFLQ